ncbi:hypothetical protein M885DRAFT_529162 [Pelagophyceae sp. CCMP2097]|nr:hypothetical protein M885DRAFT_529162 [Pelagophyceae sp. CCMP2097]|mmetsp:Transcript_9818/g.32363  ORF Transcript_9818/g.32363 Transcript_9818/m.32363 type:complete len:263 (-) Transcript_9818:53-841(-)
MRGLTWALGLLCYAASVDVAKALSAPSPRIVSSGLGRDVAACCRGLGRELAEWDGESLGANPDLVVIGEEGNAAAVEACVGWAQLKGIPIVSVGTGGDWAAISLVRRKDGDFVALCPECVEFSVGGVQGSVAYPYAAVLNRLVGAASGKRRPDAWGLASLLASFSDHAELLRRDKLKLRVVMPKEQRRALIVGIVLAAAALATLASLGGNPAEDDLEDFFKFHPPPTVVRADFATAAVPAPKPPAKPAGDEMQSDDRKKYVG